MDNPVLTKRHRFLLNAFFATPVGAEFVLSGGTALSAYSFQHRLSDDLDFFTRSDEVSAAAAITAARKELGRIADGNDALFRGVQHGATHFSGAVVWTAPQPDEIKVDFCWDGPQWIGVPRIIDGVRVDSFLDIASGKTRALIDRTRRADPRFFTSPTQESKDFVDLYFLTTEGGLSIWDLKKLYEEKNSGEGEDALLDALLSEAWLDNFPMVRLLKPLTLERLEVQIHRLRDELMRPMREP